MNAIRFLGKLLVSATFAMLIILLMVDRGGNYENEVVLLIMNILFTGLIPIIASAITGRTYLQNGGAYILLMSSGLLILGLASIAVGILRFAHNSENLVVTIYNGCAFAASVLHLLAANVTKTRRPRQTRRRSLNLILTFFGTGLLLAAMAAAVYRDILPVFYDENGSTRIRNIVMWMSIAFYLSAAMSLYMQYRMKRKSDYLYWYSLFLGMFAVGLFGVLTAPGVGSMLCWMGRSAQYVSAVFVLLSMADVISRVKGGGTTLSAVMEDFFSDAEWNYRNLTDLTACAILTVDEELRVFFSNVGADGMFGTGLSGKSVLELVAEPYRDLIYGDFMGFRDSGSGSLTVPVEMVAVNGKGEAIPVQVTASYRKLPQGIVATYIMLDISYHKETERKIQRHNAILQAINQVHEKAMVSATARELSQDCLVIVECATGSRFGFISEYKQDGWYYAATNSPKWAGFLQGDKLICGESCPMRVIIQKVAEQGSPLLINASGSHPFFKSIPQDHPPITAFLGVPFLRAGRVEGVIGIIKTEGEYDQGEREILEALTPVIFEVLRNRRSEERLHDSEERFSAFMNSSPFIAAIMDEAGRYVFLNKTWEKIYNLSMADALGKAAGDLLMQEDAARISGSHAKVLESGETARAEEWMGQPGHRRCWRSIRFPFKNFSGQAFTGCIRFDITEQKQIEDALRQSEDLLRTVIEGSDDPVFLKDRRGRILMGNTAMVMAVGLPLSRIIGKTDLEIYSDEEKARSVMENDRMVLELNAPQCFEETVPTPRGDRIFLCNKSPWQDDGGRAIGIIGIAQDITDRKNMEIELKNQASELEKKNRLITDFFINISHEFKTPLSIMTLVLDLLEKTGRSGYPGMEKYLGMMKQNVYRLGRLVSNLLDITKLDAGFMEPKWVRMDIAELVENLTDSAQTYAMQRGLELTFGCRGPRRMMFTDTSMLERVLLNLLSNAIKHTSAGGHIGVRVDFGPDDARISVTDDGEGIPDEKKDIIFDRFRQVNTSLARSSEGCGIGLAITKSLTELLGGTVCFTSTLGEGSEFIVTIPEMQMEEREVLVEQSGMDLDKRIQMEFADIDFC